MWFEKAIIYQILIDRFEGCREGARISGDFIGGNIRGIIKKLPYLKELGVNTLWISPFYETSAYHGYHITDFLDVEPRFGTKEDLKELIDKVHEMKMWIIADFVPNHCSNRHPFFLEALKNKNSEYRKWFYFKPFSNKYKIFLSISDLPKLNLDYPLCRTHIIDAAKYWLEMGLDGYRLDHVIGPGKKFWKQFSEKIKDEFPNAVLIGEAWMMGIKWKELNTLKVPGKYWRWMMHDIDNLFLEYVGLLDGVLDFFFQEEITRFARGVPMAIIVDELKRHYNKFPEFFLPTFLDNHDMDRFRFISNKTILQQAASVQFQLPQPPIIYYGTEVGMTQNRSVWDYGDIQAREPMIWKRQEKDMLEFYKEIIRLRKSQSD